MFDGPEPIYLQIADNVRSQILDGTLVSGDQVMSTTAFAATYRINPATAAKAFALLVEEDVIEKRRGLGMFVTPGARRRLIAARRDRFFEDVLDPALRQARLLGISSAQLMEHITKGRP